MSRKGKYDDTFKQQALKLAKEVGATEAARQLGLTRYQLYNWTRRYSEANFSAVDALKSVDSALTLREENKLLKEQLKQSTKRINNLMRENEFLKEASAFFAASHPKLKKMNDLNI